MDRSPRASPHQHMFLLLRTLTHTILIPPTLPVQCSIPLSIPPLQAPEPPRTHTSPSASMAASFQSMFVGLHPFHTWSSYPSSDMIDAQPLFFLPSKPRISLFGFPLYRGKPESDPNRNRLEDPGASDLDNLLPPFE